MILIDTGPLVALLDRKDPNHTRCLAIARNLSSGPMITTLPCFTEAMYFVEKEGGYAAQQRLWAMQETGKLIVHPWNELELERINVLMATYKDIPMDFADASLVTAAEGLGITRIFTLDSHFHAYRINGKTPFAVF